jgi:hypothetical protein
MADIIRVDFFKRQRIVDDPVEVVEPPSVLHCGCGSDDFHLLKGGGIVCAKCKKGSTFDTVVFRQLKAEPTPPGAA